MSFLINDMELKVINFNNQDVSSVYYNNTLVWKKPKFIESSTWEEIYNLCKSRQNGEITEDEFKAQVAIGDTRVLTLSEIWEHFGRNTCEVEVIDVEKDGIGTITFQSTQAISLNYHVNSGGSPYYDWQWMWENCLAREKCQQFYNICDAKPYVKTISKGTYTMDENGNRILKYFDETFWLPSVDEVGLTATLEDIEQEYFLENYFLKLERGKEFTKGVSTPYAKFAGGKENRIKTYWNSYANAEMADQWFLRSCEGYAYPWKILKTGQATINGGSDSIYPAFVIG